MSFAAGLLNSLRAFARSIFHGSDSGGRTLLRDSQGKLVAIGGRERPEAGQLSGKGKMLTNQFKLIKGSYRIAYQFEVHTQLCIVDDQGEEILTMGVGAGTVRMGVPETGMYRLLVEPKSETGTWTVTYRPID